MSCARQGAGRARLGAIAAAGGGSVCHGVGDRAGGRVQALPFCSAASRSRPSRGDRAGGRVQVPRQALRAGRQYPCHRRQRLAPRAEHVQRTHRRQRRHPEARSRSLCTPGDSAAGPHIRATGGAMPGAGIDSVGTAGSGLGRCLENCLVGPAKLCGCAAAAGPPRISPRRAAAVKKGPKPGGRFARAMAMPEKEVGPPAVADLWAKCEKAPFGGARRACRLSGRLGHSGQLSRKASADTAGGTGRRDSMRRTRLAARRRLRLDRSRVAPALPVRRAQAAIPTASFHRAPTAAGAPAVKP